MTLPDANSDRLLFVLFSKLDWKKISDQTLMPNDVLMREIGVVVDHLLLNFDHWTAEAKSKSKTEVQNYLATTSRDDLKAEIIRRIPQRRTLGRRIMKGSLFSLFLFFAILLSPILMLIWLGAWVLRPLEKDEHRPSLFQSLGELAESLTSRILPEPFPPCYCCVTTEYN